MPRLISALEQLFATDSLSGGPYLALNYSSLTGSFSIAETITGGTSGATAVIQNNITPQITCRTVSGEFQIGETITGGTSGATATLDNFFLYDFPNGASPLENGLIDFFESGSSTVRKTTYSDVAETIPNANPLVINGDGSVPNVYGTGSYRVVVRTATGVQMFARDPVGGDQGFTFGADWSSTTTYAATDVVRDAGSYWQSLVSSNQNNQPSTDVGVNWSEVPFVDITTNTTNIAANTTNIAINAANIETNITNIATNAAAIFGAGQTLQDVTGSRSVGVNYTNIDPNAILVCVSSFTAGALNPVVNGVAAFGGAGLGVAGGIRSGVSFTVPSGAVYSIATGATVDKWTELKL